VLLLNGACEAFWLLAHALRPARAACVHPSFTEPEAALRATGAEVVRVALGPGWELDPTRIPDDVDLVVVGNPNNPTGTLTEPRVLAGVARPGRLLVVDESFIEFTGDPAASLATSSDLAGVVVVRSVTKLFGLAGIRCGYLLAEPELVSRLEGQRQPWSVNSVACRALIACANDDATAEHVAAAARAARTELLRGLAALDGVIAWPSEANFVLLAVPDGPALVEALRARDIAVRPAASFPGLGQDHIRIAVRPPADNARLLAALQEVL
jgi:histidinol-phosphate/aromatic aminotransferase/cobyric acid decarboxylase-like protein